MPKSEQQPRPPARRGTRAGQKIQNQKNNQQLRAENDALKLKIAELEMQLFQKQGESYERQAESLTELQGLLAQLQQTRAETNDATTQSPTIKTREFHTQTAPKLFRSVGAQYSFNPEEDEKITRPNNTSDTAGVIGGSARR